MTEVYANQYSHFDKIASRTHTTDMIIIRESVSLNNGVVIPRIGFGVFRITEPKEGEIAIETAIDAGYRLIDTASVYGNEELVGKVLKASGIPRDEFFITTKAWNDELGGEKTQKAFEQSLKRLATDYIDLYLIHWPLFDQAIEAWQTMERLLQSGKVRAIGVSNFTPHHIERLKSVSDIVPAVNQVEFHPYLVQSDLKAYCDRHGIQLEAWSPFMRGKVLSDPTLQRMAAEKEKSTAQIALRWLFQKDIIAIPKSVTPERIIANSRIFDFQLSNQEMSVIDGLDKNEHLGASPDNFIEYFKTTGV